MMNKRKTRKSRRKTIHHAIPVTVMSSLFFSQVQRFEIEGEGRFLIGRHSLDEAMSRHLKGEASVSANPLSPEGTITWNVIHFDRSDDLQHPFARAREFADALKTHSIPSLIEVTEDGKGHYRLWLFHAHPVAGRCVARALTRFGNDLFHISLDMAPKVTGDTFVPIPLQGESLLLQRRVFVNAVGKMIKDQGEVLTSVSLVPGDAVTAFIERYDRAEDTGIPGKDDTVPTGESSQMSLDMFAAEPLPEQVYQAGPEQVQPSHIREKRPVETKKMKRPAHGERTLMIFTINGKLYGFDNTWVDEVLSAGDLHAVPGTTGRCAGVVKYGDVIIPVVHMGVILGGEREVTPPDARIIIVSENHRRNERFGLLVDRVLGSRTVFSTGSDNVPACDAADDNDIGTEGYQLVEKKHINNIDIKKLHESFAGAKQAGSTHHLTTRDETRMVLFSYESALLGLEAERVREIMPAGKVPASVRYGGREVEVYKLARVLSSDYSPTGKAGEPRVFNGGRIIVVEGRNFIYGLAVPRVDMVGKVQRIKMESLPGILSEQSVFTDVVGKTEDSRLVFIIDPGRVGGDVI